MQLTPVGKKLVARLDAHWAATVVSIEQLEEEIGHPLRRVLEDTARARAQQGCSQRLGRIKQRLIVEGSTHD
ncbi:hypothetical protein A9179_13250 [Pseudomonas alcaligenes]|uniref:MarR family transcriptional regulator n=1 Tax=Aquipseudomonas alcaligenes TaxID=43263 RepID=A0ABR7S0Z5_AQUAC|nr:hypothetical protein [Pseudomonas alcaligenes]MBC9251245.1 hypothetical protein [Pseudomonas alcaligenes]